MHDFFISFFFTQFHPSIFNGLKIELHHLFSLKTNIYFPRLLVSLFKKTIVHRLLLPPFLSSNLNKINLFYLIGYITKITYFFLFQNKFTIPNIIFYTKNSLALQQSKSPNLVNTRNNNL